MTIDENSRLLWPFHRKFSENGDADDEDEEDDEEEVEDDDTDNPCAYRRIKETVECYQKPCLHKQQVESGNYL